MAELLQEGQGGGVAELPAHLAHTGALGSTSVPQLNTYGLPSFTTTLPTCWVCLWGSFKTPAVRAELLGSVHAVFEAVLSKQQGQDGADRGSVGAGILSHQAGKPVINPALSLRTQSSPQTRGRREQEKGPGIAQRARVQALHVGPLGSIPSTS